MRLYNVADREVRGAIRLHAGLAKAVETNLNEEEGEGGVRGAEVP